MHVAILLANGMYMMSFRLISRPWLLKDTRLKQSLNLPQIEPRPPCPPRIYNKLYTHFSTILKAQKRSRPPAAPKDLPPSTPSKRKAPRSNQPTPLKDKPTPLRPVRQPRKSLLFSSSLPSDISAWIHPTIRHLCTSLHAPAAAHHILAGVTTILTTPSPVASEGSGKGEDKKDRIPALLGAVYFFVRTRLQGVETSGKEYIEQREKVLEGLEQARKEVDAKKGKGKGEDRDALFWKGWEDVGTGDVDAYLQEISGRGWLDLDWFQNVIEGSGLELEQGVDEEWLEDEEMRKVEITRARLERKDALKRGVLMGGLGTMMQDRVDWLSEERREDFRSWKEDVLGRIKEIEASA
jgi:origin recognition complex subunit 6